MKGVEHIDFEVELITNVIPIKGYSFYKGNMRNKHTLDIMGLPAIANSKSMINGKL